MNTLLPALDDQSPDKILADLSQRFVNRKGLQIHYTSQEDQEPTHQHETIG